MYLSLVLLDPRKTHHDRRDGVIRNSDSSLFQTNLNGDVLGCDVAEVFLPQLKTSQMVILDHLSCHQLSGIKEGVEKAGVGFKILTS